MRVADIKKALFITDGVEKTECPNCDKLASFSIKELDGDAVFNCENGCSREELENAVENVVSFMLDAESDAAPMGIEPAPATIEPAPEAMGNSIFSESPEPATESSEETESSKFVLGDCDSISLDEAKEIANRRGFLLAPNNCLSVKDAAAEIARKVKGVAFLQEGVPKFRFNDDDGFCELNERNFISFVECFGAVAEVVKIKIGKEPKYIAKRCLLSQAKSRAIINSTDFLRALEEVGHYLPFPVVIVRDGKPEVVKGYDAATKIFAEEWELPEVSLNDAVANLLEIIGDYNFESDADRSRAIASLITPMMSFGKHIQNRVPLDYTEAEKSQSGKSYRNRLTSAVYGISTPAISKGDRRERLEESLNKNIADGHPFIALDNIKNNLDSEEIESLITGEHHHCRAPWLQKDANPRNHIFMLTTNGARLSKDLANRIYVTRILESNAAPKEYAEGDILGHVLANREKFLASVIRIVSEWVNQGRQVKPATLRDFRKEWAQKLDWIVQEIFGLKPLLQGHEEITGRVSSSAANRIRDIFLAIQQAGRLNEFLSASEILNICKSEEMPLLDSKGDELKIVSLGRELSMLYGGEGTFSLEKFTVRLDEQPNPFDSSKKTKRHYFEMISPDRGKISPDSPLDIPLDKTLVSPDSPDTWQHVSLDENLKSNSLNSKSSPMKTNTHHQGNQGFIRGKSEETEIPLRGRVSHNENSQPLKESALDRYAREGRERAALEEKRNGGAE